MQRPLGATARYRDCPGKMPVLGAGTTERRASRLLGAQGRLCRVDCRRRWRRAELGSLLPALRLLRHDRASQALDNDAEERPGGSHGATKLYVNQPVPGIAVGDPGGTLHGQSTCIEALNRTAPGSQASAWAWAMGSALS